MAVIREVKNKAEAKKLASEVVEAASQIKEFQAEVDKLAKKRGIVELKQIIPVNNQRILNFMQKEGMKKLDLDDLGYVNFIQATSEHVWIETKADLETLGDTAGKKVKPLRSILGKERWMKITRRRLDKKLLEQAVDEGWITEKEIEPAHFTRKRAPYLGYEKGPA